MRAVVQHRRYESHGHARTPPLGVLFGRPLGSTHTPPRLRTHTNQTRRPVRKGGTIKDTKTDSYKLTAADGTEKTFPSATFTVERDGSTNLIRAVFMHDGEHLFAFNFVAGDEATLDTMLKGISVES